MHYINKVIEIATKLKTFKLSDQYVLQFLLRPVFLRYMDNNIRDFGDYLNISEAEELGVQLDKDFATVVKVYGLDSIEFGFSYGKYLSEVKSYYDRKELLYDYLITIFNLSSKESQILSGKSIFNIILREISIRQKNVEYMPEGISILIKGILDFEDVEHSDIYSPCIGYGELVKTCAYRNINVHGQDISDNSVQIALMNFLINGFRNVNLKVGNTLTNPLFINNTFELKKYGAIVAALPDIRNWFDQGKSSDNIDYKPEYDRYSRFNNVHMHSSRSDVAFIYHIVNSLTENGVGIILLSSTFLNRSIDLAARKDLLDNLNVIQAVISLGKSTKYATFQQYSIIVLKRGRKTNEDMLFVDATSPSATRRAPLHRELTSEAIGEVLKTYKTYKKKSLNEQEYAIVKANSVSVEKIRKNGYSFVFNEDDIEQSIFDKKIDEQLISKRIELNESVNNLKQLFDELRINGIYL